MTVWPEPRPDPKPLLLLDVDGVLNAVCDRDAPPDTWDDWCFDGDPAFTAWSPSMVAALKALQERVEIQWLTTWWNMTERLAFLGLGPLRVANTEAEYLALGLGPLAWWKLTTVQRLRQAEPDRLIIWIDDDLGFDKPALEWARAQPAGTMLGICPKTRVGLTPAAIESIHEWLDGHA